MRVDWGSCIRFKSFQLPASSDIEFLNQVENYTKWQHHCSNNWKDYDDYQAFLGYMSSYNGMAGPIATALSAY